MEYCEANAMTPAQFNVIKYVSRFNLKNPGDCKKQIEDLNKAIHCIEFIKDNLINDFAESAAKEVSFTHLKMENLNLRDDPTPAEIDDLWRREHGFRPFSDEADLASIDNDDIAARLDAYNRRGCMSGSCDI